MPTYLKGDATKPVGDDNRYVVHVCNDRGGWGAGFVVAVSKCWSEPEEAYRDWFKSKTHPLWGHFELGNIQIVKVAPNLSVVNMIAQSGYGQGNRHLHRTSEPDSRPPIRYDALEQCLEKVAASAKVYGASLHGPRFGAGLGGGRWSAIEPIIEQTLNGLAVTIYDL